MSTSSTFTNTRVQQNSLGIKQYTKPENNKKSIEGKHRYSLSFSVRTGKGPVWSAHSSPLPTLDETPFPSELRSVERRLPTSPPPQSQLWPPKIANTKSTNKRRKQSKSAKIPQARQINGTLCWECECETALPILNLKKQWASVLSCTYGAWVTLSSPKPAECPTSPFMSSARGPGMRESIRAGMTLWGRLRPRRKNILKDTISKRRFFGGVSIFWAG